jgi:3-phenylpropionate/trans-cinnamate dioxygenase ferredoxin subunit
MTEKKYSWLKLADSIAALMLPVSGIMEVELAGKKFCITLYKDQLFACTANCPHAGGTLEEGYIDNFGNIVCPIHRYRFNLQNGRNSSGEGYFLKTYPVEMREDGIYIGIENKGLLSWLK